MSGFFGKGRSGIGGGGGGRKRRIGTFWDLGGGLPVLHGRYDRFCLWCGKVYRNEAHFKSLSCPNPACALPFPGRSEPCTETDWIHCRNCDAWTHHNFNYCNMCGEETVPGRSESKKMEHLAQKRPSASFPTGPGVQDPSFSENGVNTILPISKKSKQETGYLKEEEINAATKTEAEVKTEAE